MKKFLAGIFFLLSGLSPIEVPAASSFYDYVSNVTRYCGWFDCSSCSGIEVEKGYFHHQMLIDCHSCMPGYHLGDAVYEGEHARVFHNVCLRDTPVCPSNCSSCSDSSTCTSCDYGYTLSNGECVKKPTCSNGQYTASDGTCQPCSNISVPNGSCLSCSSSSQCDNISCNAGYVKKGGTCVKAATCTYPLKEVTDYSGECAGCCTD